MAGRKPCVWFSSEIREELPSVHLIAEIARKMISDLIYIKIELDFQRGCKPERGAWKEEPSDGR